MELSESLALSEQRVQSRTGLQKREPLESGLAKRAHTRLIDQIENAPPDEPLVVVATGQYLGSGFRLPATRPHGWTPGSDRQQN